MVPYFYTKEELNETLINSGITKYAPSDCKDFMALRGWTLRKSKRVEGETKIVKHNGVLRKLGSFNGYSVVIGKDDKEYSALMETEADALLVCILMAIRYQ